MEQTATMLLCAVMYKDASMKSYVNCTVSYSVSLFLYCCISLTSAVIYQLFIWFDMMQPKLTITINTPQIIFWVNYCLRMWSVNLHRDKNATTTHGNVHCNCACKQREHNHHIKPASCVHRWELMTPPIEAVSSGMPSISHFLQGQL